MRSGGRDWCLSCLGRRSTRARPPGRAKQNIIPEGTGRVLCVRVHVLGIRPSIIALNSELLTKNGWAGDISRQTGRVRRLDEYPEFQGLGSGYYQVLGDVLPSGEVQLYI